MKISDVFKKQFYIYYYHKIKRERPVDYIFFDWKVFASLVLIFTCGLLIFFPKKIEIIIPDLKSQAYILESILRTVSIFVGISFSFIILSFNVFYKYFGRYAFLDFFKRMS